MKIFIKSLLIIIWIGLSGCLNAIDDPSPADYRIRFTGNFHFTTYYSSFSMGQTTYYDTIVYDGYISIPEDHDISVIDENDSLILIRYGPGEQTLNCQNAANLVINPSGTLKHPKEGRCSNHYYNNPGSFVFTDNISFGFSSGGLGATYSQSIRGNRIK